MTYTLTLITQSGQSLARHSLNNNSTLRIQAVDNVQYQLSDMDGLAPQEVSASRSGDDLLIQIDNEPSVVIEDYFLFDDSGLKNPVIGLQDNEQYEQYIVYPLTELDTKQSLLAGEIGDPAAIGAEENYVAYAALVALGAVGTMGLIINSHSSDDNDNTKNNAANNSPTGKVTINGTAEVGQTLTAGHTLQDTDGIGSVTYRWYADGKLLATGDNYRITEAEAGKTLTVTASYTDGQGNAESVSSQPTGTVVGKTPTADLAAPTLEISADKTALKTGESTTLTFTLSEAVEGFEANDINAANGVLSNFSKISETVYTATYTANTVGSADIQVSANSFTDLANNVNRQNAALVLSISAPTNNSPTGKVTINGTAEVGQTLTAGHTLQDADGIGSVTYRWYADGKLLATGDNYRITEAEAGKTLTVTASYTDGQGNAESVSSQPTGTVADNTDVINTPGEIMLTGSTREGDTLHAVLSDANGVSPSVEYQWFANRERIVNANSASYRLSAAEVGKQIQVVARYTDNGGHNESVSSDYSPAVRGAPVSIPVAPDNNLPTVSIVGAGSVREGESITYTVMLDRPAPTDMSVDVHIIYDSADDSDVAIQGGNQRVIIKAGESNASFTVEAATDTLLEDSEGYRIEIDYLLTGKVYSYDWNETPPASPPVSEQSIIIPAYHYPDGASDPYWSEVQYLGGNKIPFVVINPASGPGQSVDGNYSTLMENNVKSGIDNIVYIKTVYGTRPLEEVKAEIQKYFDFYGKNNIHGFFFDEVGTQSNQQTLYMAELYNHVKALSADNLVIANPGAYITDSIAPYADIFVTSEVSADTYINNYQTPRSAFENDPANAKHIYHIVHSASPEQYNQLVELSRTRNAGWLFVTSDQQQADNNPYDELPTDFSSLANNINSLGMPAAPKGDMVSPPSVAGLGQKAAVDTTIIDTSVRKLSSIDEQENGKLIISEGIHPNSYAKLLLAEKENLLFDTITTHGEKLLADPQEGVHNLQGGDGDDILIASAAADTMSGGKGADTFVFVATAIDTVPVLDRILDFHVGEDLIRLHTNGNDTPRFDESSQQLYYRNNNSGPYHSVVIHSHDGSTLTETDILKSISVL